MNLLRSRFAQAVLILIVAFVVLKFGIRPAAPWSVLTLYMSIVRLPVLVFVASDSDSWPAFVRSLLTSPGCSHPRRRRFWLPIVLAPLCGYSSLRQARSAPARR